MNLCNHGDKKFNIESSAKSLKFLSIKQFKFVYCQHALRNAMHIGKHFDIYNVRVIQESIAFDILIKSEIVRA